MKKVMFVMAVAGMFAFAACNNNAKTENTDTTAAEPAETVVKEPTVMEDAVDSTAVDAEASAETVQQ